MNKQNKNIRNHGIIIQGKEIKRQGNTGAVLLPKWTIGMKAKVIVYEEVFKCSGCGDVMNTKYESKTPGLCVMCELSKNAFKTKKCLQCGKVKEDVNEYGFCKECEQHEEDIMSGNVIDEDFEPVFGSGKSQIKNAKDIYDKINYKI